MIKNLSKRVSYIKKKKKNIRNERKTVIITREIKEI